MLDGIFTEAALLAKEAIRVARACEPVARAQEIHATTTLGRRARLGTATPTARSTCCARPSARHRTLDDPDALFRITANLTTVLDLVGRRAEAVDVAYAGIEDARRAGLEAVYGNFLRRQRGRIAVPARALGRGARRSASRALSWLPVGVVFLAAVLQLAVVEIETDAGERRGPAPRPDDHGVRRPARTAARRARTTWRPRRSRCGAATSPTRAGRSTVAGRASARPRSGSSPPGWPRWSRASTRRPPPRLARTGSWRPSPRPASARPRCCARRRRSSVPAAPRARPDRAASPRRTWRPPGPSSGAWKATTTPAVWRASPSRGRP